MSCRSLPDRMGYRPGQRARILGLPEGFTLFAALTTGDPADWHAAFVRDASAIAAAVPVLVPGYQRSQHLWFCYPKLSGSIRTDITRDKGWDPLKALDLLPVTQVAVDETWSALRFRYRDEIKTLTRKF
ncbi:MAG: hypothetical protein NTX73_09850 [Rhodobacterales bacterium]|nr:hypothetical protein [Rhodobacterales bacterium]